MRRFNLCALFALSEFTLLYVFFRLFLRADESRVLAIACSFAVVQLALLAFAMRVAELERDRGKSSQRIALERLRRNQTIGLWAGGIIYLTRLAAGIWHIAQSGWSQNLVIELALWTVGAGAIFYFLHLQPHMKRLRR